MCPLTKVPLKVSPTGVLLPPVRPADELPPPPPSASPIRPSEAKLLATEGMPLAAAGAAAGLAAPPGTAEPAGSSSWASIKLLSGVA